MMQGFFARYTDAQWDVALYEHVGKRSVGFQFVRSFTDPETKDPMKKAGYERIDFADDGSIMHIEVSSSRERK